MNDEKTGPFVEGAEKFISMLEQYAYLAQQLEYTQPEMASQLRWLAGDMQTVSGQVKQLREKTTVIMGQLKNVDSPKKDDLKRIFGLLTEAGGEWQQISDAWISSYQELKWTLIDNWWPNEAARREDLIDNFGVDEQTLDEMLELDKRRADNSDKTNEELLIFRLIGSEIKAPDGTNIDIPRNLAKLTGLQPNHVGVRISRLRRKARQKRIEAMEEHIRLVAQEEGLTVTLGIKREDATFICVDEPSEVTFGIFLGDIGDLTRKSAIIRRLQRDMNKFESDNSCSTGVVLLDSEGVEEKSLFYDSTQINRLYATYLKTLPKSRSDSPGNLEPSYETLEDLFRSLKGN